MLIIKMLCATVMIKLREFLKKDISSIAEYANNPNVVRYMSMRMPSPYTLDDAKWWVETGAKETGIHRAITLDDECIGVVGATPGQLERSKNIEIGYWLAEHHWGKGYTSKALSIFSDYLFDNTDAIKLFAPVYHPNIGSMKVLEKCGYKLESIHKKAITKNNEIYDEHIYVKFRT